MEDSAGGSVHQLSMVYGLVFCSTVFWSGDVTGIDFVWNCGVEMPEGTENVWREYMNKKWRGIISLVVGILAAVAVLCFGYIRQQDTNNKNADIQNTNTQNTDIQNANAQNANTQNTNMQNTISQNTNMRNTDIQKIDTKTTDVNNIHVYETNVQQTENTAPPILTEPPVLHVVNRYLSSTEYDFEVTSGNYTWSCKTEHEDERKEVVACGAAVMDEAKNKEKIKVMTQEYGYSMFWEEMPDSVTVKEYEIADMGKMDAEAVSSTVYKDDFTVSLKPDSVYEIVAEWAKEKWDEKGFCGSSSYVIITE